MPLWALCQLRTRLLLLVTYVLAMVCVVESTPLSLTSLTSDEGSSQAAPRTVSGSIVGPVSGSPYSLRGCPRRRCKSVRNRPAWLIQLRWGAARRGDTTSVQPRGAGAIRRYLEIRL